MVLFIFAGSQEATTACFMAFYLLPTSYARMTVRACLVSADDPRSGYLAGTKKRHAS